MAEAYERLGDLLGRKSYANLGRLGDALTAYEKCSNLLTLAATAAPRQRMASCLMKQADIVEQLRGPVAAMALYQRAIAIDRAELEGCSSGRTHDRKCGHLGAAARQYLHGNGRHQQRKT